MKIGGHAFVHGVIELYTEVAIWASSLWTSLLFMNIQL